MGIDYIYCFFQNKNSGQRSKRCKRCIPYHTLTDHFIWVRLRQLNIHPSIFYNQSLVSYASNALVPSRGMNQTFRGAVKYSQKLNLNP